MKYTFTKADGSKKTVEIADASQLRTYFSDGSYDSRKQERSNVMTKRTRAVVAMNADFAKYTYDFGYIIRQGVFYRDALDQQKYPREQKHDLSCSP